MRSPVPIQETFKVFEDPYNLAKITPAWLNFRITTPPPLEMKRDLRIEYKIKWLGLPMYWRTVITSYEPPFLFVDEQEQGPYVLWRHRHTFEPSEEGTLVRDQVDYILPLGPLGAVAHGLVVGQQLKAIFAYRQRALREFFGEGVRYGDVGVTVAP